MFSDVKRYAVLKAFPDMQIYSLYGHSETGFIGVNTSACNYSYHHLLSDFFFIELTEKKEILVTDLTNPLIPLFRYYVGDIGELIENGCECGNPTPVLFLKGRCVIFPRNSGQQLYAAHSNP